MFGHHVAWNYNQDGDYHFTFPGGCCSIILKLIITIYAYLQMKQMILYENNDQFSDES